MYQNTSLHLVLDKITVDLNYNHNAIHFHNQLYKYIVLFMGRKIFQAKIYTISFTEATKMKHNGRIQNFANRNIFNIISWLYSTYVITQVLLQ